MVEWKENKRARPADTWRSHLNRRAEVCIYPKILNPIIKQHKFQL